MCSILKAFQLLLKVITSMYKHVLAVDTGVQQLDFVLLTPNTTLVAQE